MAEIGIQFCAFILLVEILYLSFSKNKLKVQTNLWFKICLYVALLCVFSDIVSIYSLDNFDSTPFIITYVSCKLYIVTILHIGYCCFVYNVVSCENVNKRKYFIIPASVWTLIGSILILVLPIYFNHEDGELYTYGISVYLTYFFTIPLVLATIIYGLSKCKVVKKEIYQSITAWMILWLSAAIIQFTNSYLPLVAFAIALGLNVIFTRLENPETYKDKSTGVFSFPALMTYLQDKYDYNKTVSLLFIYFDLSKIERDTNMYRSIILTIANQLQLFNKATIFKYFSNGFLLIYDDKQTLDDDFEELKIRLNCPIHYEGQEVNVPKHYYIIPSSTIASTPDELLNYINAYIDKKPDNSVDIINEYKIESIKRSDIIKREIIDALAEDRLEVFYQPIYSTADKKFTSAEALARIRNRDGSIMMPGDFIPIAEQSNLIIPIGERVFKNVCKFIKKYDIENLGMRYIEINLSIAQCEKKTLAYDFKNIISEVGVNASLINLEITETASSEAKNSLLQNMSDLILQGISFSLDDFGTGQSNLDYMVSMPISIIKFDKTMVQSYFNRYNAKIIMVNIIDMIKQLGLHIVAEGVETKEQLDALSKLEIDYIQGFYFSKPLPKDEFLEFIKEHNNIE